MTRLFRTGAERRQDDGDNSGRRECRRYSQGDKRVTKRRKEWRKKEGKE
jgi:hypothetical protein